ncbi:MAG: anti-sigma factor antagonist [Bacteroidetes bacterium]|nr:MAG: anti-sigma factor antagonist [Bacteroidota bacterium]
MEIKTKEAGDVQVVYLEGNLDTNTAGSAETHLNALMDSGASKILINLKTLEYMSSAGLRVLLATTKKIKGKGGQLRISDLNETVREVFEISGFSMIFSVFDTEEKALEGF